MAKSRRGFAAMSKEERVRISRLGGEASGRSRSKQARRNPA